MRKKNLCNALLCAAAAMMFSSCLDGGSNVIRNYALGIVRLDTKTNRNVLDVSEYDSFYSPAFSMINEGVCCQVLYTLDFGLPDNTSEVVAANGYYTVTIEGREEISRYPLLSALIDTATVLADECPVLNPLVNLYGYVKGVLFISHQLKQPSDQQTTWQLSYDPDNGVKEEDGVSVYDLYLRAVVKSPGSKSPEEQDVLIAYDLGAYLQTIAQAEKALNHSTFHLRFNSVSKITEEQLIWKQSDKRPVQVTDILGTAAE